MATTTTKLLAHSCPVIGSIYHVIIKRTRFTRKYSERVSNRAGERGYSQHINSGSLPFECCRLFSVTGHRENKALYFSINVLGSLCGQKALMILTNALEGDYPGAEQGKIKGRVLSKPITSARMPNRARKFVRAR